MHGAPVYGEDNEPEVRMLQKVCRSRVRMASVGGVVAQKVSRWVSPGIVGLPWRVDAHNAGQEVHKHRKLVRKRGAPNVTHSVVWGT